MKALIILLLVGLAVAQEQFQYMRDPPEFDDAALGSHDMARAYRHMRRADQYFHARGKNDAARVIRDRREAVQMRGSGRGAEDSRVDQQANHLMRNRGDFNRYRPAGLPI
ncbi:serum amyloid A protein-like [Aquarana catesbeiana]|uniref:serum amyloid A protein-like n=1 Tax=Aquarana catesbeiana TaxID=8400 RepID=UPI003CCA3AD4